MNSQWLVIGPGGGIQLVNGDTPQPNNENWAVFKVKTSNFIGIEITQVSGNKEVVYNPLDANPL